MKNKIRKQKMNYKIFNVAFFIAITLLSNRLLAQNVIAKIKLAAINDALTYNQTNVGDGFTEYDWSINIDVDNNTTTGNDGIDVSMKVMHFKAQNSSSVTGTILLNNQCNTWIPSNNFPGSFATVHTLSLSIDYNDSSLVMQGSALWAELSGINANSRYSASTYHYDNNNSQFSDATNIISVTQTIIDRTGDVSKNFIDIKQASISFPTTTGINQKLASSTQNITFAPNVFSNRAKIVLTSENKNEEYTLMIYNSNGQFVKQLDNVTHKQDVYFERENLNSGLYFYNVIDKNNTITTGKFIIE